MIKVTKVAEEITNDKKFQLHKAEHGGEATYHVETLYKHPDGLWTLEMVDWPKEPIQLDSEALVFMKDVIEGSKSKETKNE